MVMSVTGLEPSPTGAGSGRERLLPGVKEPQDLKRLPPEALPVLASEIREFLVDRVSKTGGHLGPNLGVVELTLAIHRVFESPNDRIVFDTGHQAYVHKMLTGRQSDFAGLRQRGGLSGYPSQAESEHDLVENSHASTALSYADGLAKAYALRGERRQVVAVVGDGALTGGMCWEALNNIAASDRPVVIVVNDNGRSYSPTIGGLANHLAALRLNPSYEKVLAVIKDSLARTPLVGPPLYDALHAVKKGLKDATAPQAMFEDLGIKYVGPVDGHDVTALESALVRASRFGRPVIVHAVTRKGYGYAPAEGDEADCLHSPSSAFDPETAKPLQGGGKKWTAAFADELAQIAGERSDIVGITAAMAGPTGLEKLRALCPERFFDVGIAEQHAVTSAAGLAMGGMHPVVAIYATFLNRAFDQLLLDVALHRLPVTFVLDRAGITGPDGPSHYGIWDLALLGVVPGLVLAAPRDETTLREELREAVGYSEGPSVVRFPTGSLPSSLPALERIGSGIGAVDVLSVGERQDVLLVAVGAFGHLGIEVAQQVREQGYGVTVVDPRWLRPVPERLVELAGSHRVVVSVEDGVRAGGFGTALAQAIADAGTAVPVRDLGVVTGWHPYGSRNQLLADLGLTVGDVADRVTEFVSGLD
jgi:1-deoxy-D-xylulose-5-phosphate synthase